MARSSTSTISYPCDLEAQMLEYSACRARTAELGHARHDRDDACLRAACRAHAEPQCADAGRSQQRSARPAQPIVDLTESNPTRAGCPIPPICSQRWRDRARARATSRSRSACARRARRSPRDYARRGVRDRSRSHRARRRAPARPTAGCSSCCAIPGDAVLVPRPSYPLFEHLTRLEGVRAVPYRLEYHGRWEIDFDALARGARADAGGADRVAEQSDRLVSCRRASCERLVAVCRDAGWALIADEVFADYPLESSAPVTDIAARRGRADVHARRRCRSRWACRR